MIELFPILKNDKLVKGYVSQHFLFFSNLLYLIFKEHIYDQEKNRGFLEWHIRNLRSNNQSIDTRSYKKRQKPDDSFENETEDKIEIERTVTLLKNIFVNTQDDKETVESGMNQTYKSRIKWIQKNKPTITRILEEYPKFKELPFLVSII